MFSILYMILHEIIEIIVIIIATMNKRIYERWEWEKWEFTAAQDLFTIP